MSSWLSTTLSMPATLNSRQLFSVLSPILLRWPLPMSLPRLAHQRSRSLPNMSVSNWHECWYVLAAVRMPAGRRQETNVMQPRWCLCLQPCHPTGNLLFLANANTLVSLEFRHWRSIVFSTWWSKRESSSLLDWVGFTGPLQKGKKGIQQSAMSWSYCC